MAIICITSAGNTCHRGVAFVVHKKIAGNVTSFEGVSDRLAQLTLKINSKYHLNIIQAYLPATSHTDEEVDIAVISQQGVTSIITPICLPQTWQPRSDKFLSIFSEEDINYKLATFNHTFLSTLDAHAPIKSIWIRSRPCPYLTTEIKDQMTFRDQLFRRYRESQNADAWKASKEARRSVKQRLKNAGCDHIHTEVQSHKVNPLWKIINTCIPSKEKRSNGYR